MGDTPLSTISDPPSTLELSSISRIAKGRISGRRTGWQSGQSGLPRPYNILKYHNNYSKSETNAGDCGDERAALRLAWSRPVD